MPLRLSNLLECSRPLLFENDDEDFPYSCGGTCFLVSYEQKIFAITAKHCLIHRDIQKVLISPQPEVRHFLPLCRLDTIDRPIDQNDSTWSDLAFFEIDLIELAEIDPPLQLPHCLDLNLEPHGGPLIPRDSLLVTRGFPTEISHVDSERLVIHEQAFGATGIYAGRAPDAHCHHLRFHDRSLITDINGISGSPVFYIRETSAGLFHRFAGVIVQGSRELNVPVTFIHASVVFTALTKLARTSS